MATKTRLSSKNKSSTTSSTKTKTTNRTPTNKQALSKTLAAPATKKTEKNSIEFTVLKKSTNAAPSLAKVHKKKIVKSKSDDFFKQTPLQFFSATTSQSYTSDSFFFDVEKKQPQQNSSSSATLLDDYNLNNQDPSFLFYGKHPHGETGQGTPQIPHRQPIRKEISNSSGCFHCPSDKCICSAFSDLMKNTIARCSLRRETDGRPGRKDLCAKSLNANFVSRCIREMDVEPGDTFFDFGSGNGSILFQVAAQVPGVKCVGIELNAHNAELSRQLYKLIKPDLELLAQKFAPSSSEKVQPIELVTGDVLDFMAKKDFWRNATNPRTGKGPVILCSNLLWPRPVTHYVQERCRDAPIDTRIVCFDDFFPHGRSVCQVRDPEIFQLFEMKDYIWPRGAVEWAPLLEGKFYIHRKIQNRSDIEVMED